MKIITILSILLVFSLYSCNQNKYEQYESFSFEFAEQLREEKPTNPWFLSGIGGSLNQKIDLSFLVVSNQVDLNEARATLLEGTEKLLNKINNNTKIRPYFSHYPLTYNDIEISIIFLDNNGYPIKDSIFIVNVDLHNGKIYYYKNDELNKRFELNYEETYEEALRIEDHK